MKRFIYLLICLFGITSVCLATTAVYRISSGEVTAISTENNPYDNEPSDLAVITNATYPDGTTFIKRVLGSAKILDGTVIRNATQEEIDGFAAASINDYNIRMAAKSLKYFQSDAKFRLAIMAVIRGIIKEDNEQRLWIRTFMEAVALSTSLADFQSRVAGLDIPVDRELSDAKTYILGQINKDD